jgi:hypothetical protein
MLSLEKLGTTGGHGYTLHKQSIRHTTKPVHVARPYPSRSSSNGNASTGASNTDGNLQPAAAEAANRAQPRPAANAELPTSLNLAFESMEKNSKAVKTTGLRRAPLSGGVKNATQRFDLPSPCVAVRNLVEQAQFAHLCTVMSHMHHRWVWGCRRCVLACCSSCHHLCTAWNAAVVQPVGTGKVVMCSRQSMRVCRQAGQVDKVATPSSPFASQALLLVLCVSVLPCTAAQASGVPLWHPG